MSIPLRVRLCFVALVVAGCGLVETGPPAPTPADFQGIATEVVKRGVMIDGIVSGDAGCDDPVLAPTAIAFNASGLDQASPARIYLYIFRNRDSFERLRATIDTCAGRYITDPETFESIEQSPFVATGQGPWAPAFEAALRTGLETAAGTGD